ncbi:phosphatases II [Lentinula aff. detonsa]|uniref:phosphatidylinositol-3,4,5-trisphosphate 3-phosphatase n=1 Tax=Lentinula aff. detonsa TaxID=2804958 RepID=A0AA38KY11_9AGAR|nr:phosphatases II [Lentinula aff. detonsa]
MADYIRRIVSGNKARFRDGKLNLELDLVYITDQVIIMGFPAAGIEGLYRNRREDAKKFLDHRHGKNYWVFNFCPLKENSYPADTFDGRVSRYPFPDHHAPPLAIMPLVAREMRIWLDGSPERVAVLHCKAGKGRSGTMACAYLLSNDKLASPPRLERSYSRKQWAKMRADEMMNVISEDSAPAELPNNSMLVEEHIDSPAPMSGPISPEPDQPQQKSYGKALEHVLSLHTSRRMKVPSAESDTVKQGVSIPSQRRFLYYWSLLLSHEAPSHFWATEPLVPLPDQDTTISSLPVSEKRPRPKVRLTEIKIRMKELSNVRINLVRAANAVIERTNMSKSAAVTTQTDKNTHVWVSLARYDDDFVDTLERWERYTRMDSKSGQGLMGRRGPGTDHFGKEILSGLFSDGRWDNKKMVRSFARMGAVGEQSITKDKTEEDGKIKTYTLHPLSERSWKDLRQDLKESQELSSVKPEDIDIPASEANSMYDLTQNVKGKGVVLDAGREVRAKLYMGQVFMGWLWFIPTFHMPQPPPNSDTSQAQPSSMSSKLILQRKELDFALGIGSSVIDVEIALEWLKENEVEAVQPPARVNTEDEETAPEKTKEPGGLGATIEAIVSGDVTGIVEATQAAED